MKHFKETKVWVVTGVAGFIGSNLAETLLKLNQKVIGLDNFITGHQSNINDLLAQVSEDQRGNFSFVEGDITNFATCVEVFSGADIVLHQAAVGSVPRSIKDPMTSHKNNVDGTFNVFKAAVDAKVKRVVYASSSSVYGDHPELPKEEAKIGKPLSPYAATKLIDEIYADIFAKTYGLQTIGLRYFNVFGRRQDPNGAYAAVIPKWIASMVSGEDVFINGDGETSRDFCYIENTVQANLLAGITDNTECSGQVFNVSFGEKTTLNQLYGLLKDNILVHRPELKLSDPVYRDFREGDIRHSLANTDKIKSMINYNPDFDVRAGLQLTMKWYLENL